MKNYNDSQDQNFWVSYADLMAGLLFVFILIVGAIITKYSIIQSDIKTLRTDLEEQKKDLNISKQELYQKKAKLQIIEDELNVVRDKNLLMNSKLDELEEIKEMYNSARKELDEASEEINKTKTTLNLKDSQLLALERVLLAKNRIEKTLMMELNISKSNLLLNKKKFKTAKEELELIRNENLLINSKLSDLKEIKKMYEEAKDEINKTKSVLNIKDNELLAVERVLLAKSKAEQKLLRDLNITKSKIKNLTGIRIKVIKELKNSMGDMIKIDPKSGAIRFSAKILFDQGKYKLKPQSRQKLTKVLSKYIKTLFENREIKQHIEQIIIEGHTNSDGGYFDNLTLSQKRAGEVMRFLFTLKVADKTELKKYFTASGRSDTDLIYDKSGKEDKSASRRIEVKFRIKNEDAIKEIEKFLEKK